MSVVKTCKISIYVISTQFNELMEYLHKRGVMEISGDASGIPEKFIRNIESELKRAEDAISILAEYKPKKKATKRRRAALSDYAMNKKETAASLANISKIISLKSKIVGNKEKIEKIREKQKELENYISLGVPMPCADTENTCTVLGEISLLGFNKLTDEILGKRMYVGIIKRTKQSIFVSISYLKEESKEISEILKKYDFVKAQVGTNGNLPGIEIKRLLKKEEDLISENKKLVDEIVYAAKSRRMIEMYYDRLMLKAEKYRAAATADNTERTFIITGYVEEDKADRLFSDIKKRFCAMAVREEAEENEILPTKFKNNAFVEPVEEITASYSMPGKDDIDPNPVMAVFYYWFFGMMFSDSGYGLLMMAVCGTLAFSDVLEKRKRGMYKMFFWCGVSTTLWGILYGSFFGDLIAAVSNAFGNKTAAFKPVLIDPVNQALELLIISVAFGLIHILTALFIKFYKLWKIKKRQDAIFDVGFWVSVLIGASVLAIGFASKNELVKTIGFVMLIGGALGIVLTGGRDKKSFFMRLFAGVLSLYDITSYVGDILSYSRLMALGLATGVIASVVNVLASLGKDTPFGIVLFILVAVLGHSLNFAINMLGAYVHTNRLQYVEFYQKFYEGGGKRFRPLKMDTKYFNFLE